MQPTLLTPRTAVLLHRDRAIRWMRATLARVLRRASIALVAATFLLAAGCSGSEASAPSTRQAGSSAPSTQASSANGVQAVTTDRPGNWEITTERVDDPYTQPPGPAAPTANVPGAGCTATPNRRQISGEGILSLTLSAPQTDWSNASDISVVVDLNLDGGTSQQIVLFDGAQPFVYEGFVGGTSSGPHCVTLALRRDLSHTAIAQPRVDVYSISLSLVPASSSAYMLETHAPVLYGRSISAKGDTPLVTYGESKTDPDGTSTDLSYTVIWTHEDMGDGSVPPYEWGHWGRVSDIETVLHERVSRAGRVLSADYLSCGCEGIPGYPDSAIDRSAAGGETYKAYPLSLGTPRMDDHVAIRDATGNNDVSPFGTTPFRFQQSLVAPPGPGQSREVAMDNSPWTYRVSGQEVSREATSSADPKSLLAGVYPQYLIVDIEAAAERTSSIAVEIQLAGDPSWYSNDYAQATAPAPPTTYPFFNGGHRRTVIKLPVSWHGKAITALRLRLNALTDATPSLVGAPSIDLVEISPSYTIRHPSFPAPVVVIGTTRYPPAATP